MTRTHDPLERLTPLHADQLPHWDATLRIPTVPPPRDHTTVTFWQAVWTCVALALVGGFIGALAYGALA